MTGAPQHGLAPPAELVVFRLQEQRHAVPLSSVERVLPAAAVTPLPGAPDMVLGALDTGRSIVPVYGLRRRLGLPQPPLDPVDQFLLVRTPRRTLALVVDEVLEVTSCAQPWPDGRSLVPELEGIAGVVRLADGLLLIHDLEQLLTAPQEQALAAALERMA